MTPPAVETTPQEMASNSIAANEYFEASDMFRRRIRSMPGLGASQYKPVIAPAALNKSRSMGDVDLLRLNKRDMTFQASGKTFYIEDWVVKEGTYGLDVLFMDDNQALELETEEIIRDRTKNKLFQIFIKACGNKIPKRRHAGKSMGVLATPGKRKFSFSLPEPSPSDEGTASTARKKQCQVRQVDNCELKAEPRPRASTTTALGSAGCKQRRKRRQRNNSLPVEDPKQSTLSMYWKKDGGVNGRKVSNESVSDLVTK